MQKKKRKMGAEFLQTGMGGSSTQVGHKGAWPLVRRRGLFHLSKGKEKAGAATGTPGRSDGRS